MQAILRLSSLDIESREEKPVEEPGESFAIVHVSGLAVSRRVVYTLL